jgi:hypothetical protein
MNLDLANIDTPAASEAGFEIELDYNGKPSGWFVTVRGEHAPTVKKWQLGLGNKFRLREWQDKRKGKGDNPAPMTEEDMELGLRGAAARIAGFREIVFGGEPFQFSEKNAYELVRRHPPFADQVLEESADISNFTQPQSKT